MKKTEKRLDHNRQDLIEQKRRNQKLVEKVGKIKPLTGQNQSQTYGINLKKNESVR